MRIVRANETQIHPGRKPAGVMNSRDFKSQYGWTALAIVSWFLLGLLDFRTGFVSYSTLRLCLLVLLVVLLLPLSIPAFVVSAFDFLSQHRRAAYLFLLGLAFAGFGLFAARYLRGAVIGDNLVFKEIIEQTANGCFFCSPIHGGSNFSAHNQLFLLLFVPLVWITNWWLVAQFVHSLVIVGLCRICGWSLGEDSALGWIATIAIFLASYTQHQLFYDTRFTALAMTVFAIGFYLNKTRLMWAGTFVALLTRETAGLTLFVFGVLGTLKKTARKTMIVTAVLGLLWFVGSYALIILSGGPLSTIQGYFDPCLRSLTGFSANSSCLAASVSTDWELKAAYTIRLLRFAPSVDAVPSMIASIPDLAFTWVSTNNAMYDPDQHYYVQALGILIVGAGLASRKRFSLQYSENLLSRWIVASGIWQFVTTVNPRLF